MNLTIRHATSTDMKALAAFAGRVFSENFGHLYEPEDLADHLQKTCSEAFFSEALKHDVMILAWDEHVIAGYTKIGALGLPAEQPAEGAMEIHRLYIDVPYQAMGVGKALMEAAMKEEMITQAPEVYLGVWEHNHRAQAFYKKYGFHEVGEYLYWVGNHADRELILKRDHG